MNLNKSKDNSERPLDLIVRLLRDWRRGFTDADMRSAEIKMMGPKFPGEITLVSAGELKAIIVMQPNVKVRGGALAPSQRNEVERS